MIKKALTYFLVLLAVTWYTGLSIKHSREVNRLKSNITRLKKEMVRQWEEDSLSTVGYAEKVDSLEGILISRTKIIAYWKNQCFDLITKQDTTETGGFRVSFEKEDNCFSVSGYTITATKTEPEQARIEWISKPITLDIELTSVGERIAGRIKPGNECITIQDIKFSAPPGLFEYEKSRGFGWREFLIGSVTGILIMEVLK